MFELSSTKHIPGYSWNEWAPVLQLEVPLRYLPMKGIGGEQLPNEERP